MSIEFNNNKPEVASNPNPFSKINTFYLGGFRAFKEKQEIPIRPITLVFGPNSAGKSALFKGFTYTFGLERQHADKFQTNFHRFDFGNPMIFGFSFNTKIFNKRSSFQLPQCPEYFDDIQSREFYLEYKTSKIIKDNKYYETIYNAWRLDFSEGEGGDFSIEDLDLGRSKKCDPWDAYEKNMRLSFAIGNKKIIRFESEYKELLINEIKNCLMRSEISEHKSKYIIKCLSEEFKSTLLTYSETTGRIYVDKISTSTEWYGHCLAKYYNKKKNRGEPEFEYLIHKLVSEFNSRNYDEVIKNHSSHNDEPYYTHQFMKDVISAKFERKSSGNNINFYHQINEKTYISLVYGALLAIFSDVNIRYQQSFRSLNEKSRPKVQYISAKRDYINEHTNERKDWSPSDEKVNLKEINRWLKKLTDNFQIAPSRRLYAENDVQKMIDGEITFDQLNADYLKVDRELLISDSRVPGHLFNIDNVGFGIKKLIPVISAAVYETDMFNPKKPYDLIFIEEPEMHLHPKAQSDLGDLFVDNVINNSEKTFIIETHSENLLQRILRHVREGRISHEAISIVYVKPGTIDQGSELIPLRINSSGRFLNHWPEGFFEPRMKDVITGL